MTILDPEGNQVNKMLTWNERDWSITSQSTALTFIAEQKVSSKLYAWGTDGTSLRPLFAVPSTGLTKPAAEFVRVVADVVLKAHPKLVVSSRGR